MAKAIYKQVVNLDEGLARTRFIKMGGLKAPAKGKSKWYYPADRWPGFKITFIDRYKQEKNRNYVIDDASMAVLKEQRPELFDGEYFRAMPVTCIFDDPYRNTMSYYRSWNNEIGKSYCEGNGREAQRLINLNKPERKKIACDPSTCEIYQSKRCILKFHLWCRLPFIESDSFGECAEYRTQSHETAENIINGMKLILGITGGGNPSRGILSGVPMKLIIIPRSAKADIDEKTGQQKYGQISYNAGLVMDGTDENILQIASDIRERRALTSREILQIETSLKEIEENPDDITLDHIEFGQKQNGDNGGMPVLPNEDDDPIESAVTGETFSGPHELFDKLKWLAPQYPAYWEQKTGRILNAAHINGELGKLKTDNRALMKLYDELNAWIQENEEAGGGTVSGGVATEQSSHLKDKSPPVETAGPNGEHEPIVTPTERVDEMIASVEKQKLAGPALLSWKKKHHVELNNASKEDKKRLSAAFNKASGNGQERMFND